MSLRQNSKKNKFCQIYFVIFVVWLYFVPLITASTATKAWRHAGRREVWPLAMSESEPGIFNLDDDNDFEFSLNTTPRKERQLAFTRRPIYEISRRKPIYILFPLPEQPGFKELNPFGITIAKTRPVVDEAVEEVYRRHLVPDESLDIAFEDTKLSDAVGPNVAIHALVKNKLDCIIGYAFVYSLAPVARMSPHWQDSDSHGIPVITSVGLTANLDNRREYQLMTRISSPYKIVKDAVVSLWKFFNWTRSVYMFHDQRHGAQRPEMPYGECYLMMASLEPYLTKFRRMEHNYFMFNEEHYSIEEMKERLKKASFFSNGLCFFFR